MQLPAFIGLISQLLGVVTFLSLKHCLIIDRYLCFFDGVGSDMNMDSGVMQICSVERVRFLYRGIFLQILLYYDHVQRIRAIYRNLWSRDVNIHGTTGIPI